MQEVIPDVFLGPYSAASCSNLQYLLDHKITHIICVRHITEANIIRPNFPDRFKYLVLDIADTITENIIQHFRTVKTFIDEGLQLGGRILVHGNTGISRSAALILAYIMETYDLSYKCAFLLVKQQRFCISPNKGFVMQLMEYVPIYKAYKMQKDSQYRSENQHNKRTIHQVEEDN
ncbi:serine/threonine/tyrosine-interacting protein-like isoform X2 [Pseudomyrmex gracilis]|nr:serine/threonine/tyrosine-interacting protein-like isoform X2 [Pseudomyrmex gracilis]